MIYRLVFPDGSQKLLAYIREEGAGDGVASDQVQTGVTVSDGKKQRRKQREFFSDDVLV